MKINTKDIFYYLNFTFDTENIDPEICKNIPKKLIKTLQDLDDNNQLPDPTKEESLTCALSFFTVNPKLIKNEITLIDKKEGWGVIEWTTITQKQYDNLITGKIKFLEVEGFEDEPSFIVYLSTKNKVKEIIEQIMKDNYDITVPFTLKWINNLPVFYRFNNKNKFENYFTVKTSLLI